MDAAMDSAPCFYSSADLAFTNTLSSYGIPSPELSASFRFYMILGIAQDMQVDFIPITYQAVLGIVGIGATGDIRQRLVNPQFNLAFKRVLHDHILLNEMIILSYQAVRSHPHIISIEGISWEAADDGDMRPVLVFEKSGLGDLHHFMGRVAGIQLSFMERWSLCTQIASAVNALHLAQVVHGDIKPHNVLCFKNESAGLNAKLTDFGYSRWLAPQDAASLIYLPRSSPWNAPEYHHRGFEFAAATKTDVFSFGVYTLWLLFYNIPGLEDDFISDTSDLERRPMIELARSHVRGMIDAQHERKAVLGQIFELCLASEPEHRSTMDAILPLFQSVLLVQVLEHNIVYPKTEARHQSAARFQVALAMPQLFEIDFRVRTQIFQCLERLADETRRDDELSVYEEACLQLAFCYKMGFGVERADAKADMFLAQSHKNHVLEDQLIALKRSTNQGYNPSAVFGFWYAGGHMCTTTDAQYYREQKLLASVQAVHEREITDWAAVLGTVHWIVIAAASHYQVILENLGLLDKAEELARNVFTEVSRTLPENDIVVRGRKYTLARALYVQGKLEMVEKLVKEAVDGQRSSSDENDFAKLLQMNFLACLYATQGKLRKAAALMETLVRSFSSTFGDRHVHTLVITWNLCEIFRQQRRIKEAIVLSESLLQAATAVLGEEHELSILAKMSLTRLRWESRAWLGGYIGPRDDDTLRLDYIKSSQTLLGNDHPWTLDLMVSTVRNLIAKARFPEAIALQEQIITLSEKRPGPNHPRTIEHRGRMKYIKTMYSSYRFFERIGSLNIGQYVLTPGFRVREGLERICWPLYKKKDITNLVETPFKIDLSIGLNQG